jgi:hypothetical protein
MGILENSEQFGDLVDGKCDVCKKLTPILTNVIISAYLVVFICLTFARGAISII